MIPVKQIATDGYTAMSFTTVVTQFAASDSNISWWEHNKHRIHLDQAATVITFSVPNGPADIYLILVQDATGGRTATWPASVLWPGGSPPVLSTAANAVDIVSMIYDGVDFYAVASLSFS